jgi:glycerol uptake facilitator-like aquaporin
VATFALIFIGAGAVIAVSLGLDLTGVALAHGLVLAIMISITAGRRRSRRASRPARAS